MVLWVVLFIKWVHLKIVHSFFTHIETSPTVGEMLQIFLPICMALNAVVVRDLYRANAAYHNMTFTSNVERLTKEHLMSWVRHGTSFVNGTWTFPLQSASTLTTRLIRIFVHNKIQAVIYLYFL